MKRISTVILTALMAGSSLFAQQAFKHLGMSLEAGSTGLGINLSYPVVTDHVILSVGYNLPLFSIKEDADLSTGYVNGKVNQVNSMIDTYNKNASAYNEKIGSMTELGLDVSEMKIIDKINTIESMQANLEAKLNFCNFKAMVEIYPTTKSYFHFTLGVFVGNGEWMNISAAVDQNAWNTYQSALHASEDATASVNAYNSTLESNNAKIDDINRQVDEYNAKIDQLIAAGYPAPDKLSKVSHLPNVPEQAPVDDAAAVSINDQIFVLDKNSGGRIDMKLKIKKVKPYIGIGFGSSVPTKRRMGFQMELGAYYQGKPVLESAQENPAFEGSFYRDKTIDELVKTIVRMQWYPQISLRWTGRLF